MILLILALLWGSVDAVSVGVCPGCKRSQWYRYAYSNVGGTVFGYYSTSCDFFTTTHGDPRFYTCGSDYLVFFFFFFSSPTTTRLTRCFSQPIPPTIDPKWGEGAAVNITDPNLNFNQTSRVVTCLSTDVDTNWFQAFVYVPPTVVVTTFQIAFVVDDGARVTIFNSLWPNGSPPIVNTPTSQGSYMFLDGTQGELGKEKKSIGGVC